MHRLPSFIQLHTQLTPPTTGMGSDRQPVTTRVLSVGLQMLQAPNRPPSLLPTHLHDQSQPRCCLHSIAQVAPLKLYQPSWLSLRTCTAPLCTLCTLGHCISRLRGGGRCEVHRRGCGRTRTLIPCCRCCWCGACGCLCRCCSVSTWGCGVLS